MIAHPNKAMGIAIGLVGAPPELAEAISSAVASVQGCALVSTALDRVSELVLGQDQLGLVLAYVADAESKSAVLELLELAESCQPAVPVVVLAEPSLASEGASFLTRGVADFLLRPISLSRLTFLIDFLTLRARRGSSQAQAWDAPVQSSQPVQGGLIFPSEAGQRLYATALKLARVDTTVLLQGETGSGKTCVARLIHESSPRRGKPFVVVNCGSLPESLLEGELFGFRQGAYTGADRNHRGKCAQAEDGTLFLDEIDSLSLKAQSSLLRVVEDRSFEPLGSDRTEKLRARLVFATNRDLAQEVAAGHFRQDLYYRLNVVALTIPALRARRAAIPLLVDAFLQELRERRVTEVKAFSGDALAVMSRYSWPGNLRELRNVVERVAVLTDRELVTADELPAEICMPTGRGAMVTENCVELEDSQSSTSHLQGARRSAERHVIVRTLEKCAQNRSLAAQMLGISRAALYKKLQQLQIA